MSKESAENNASGSAEHVEEKKENDVEAKIDLSTIKHPLKYCWTLWYSDNEKNVTWQDNQKEVSSFNTIEDFWSVFNHIKTASQRKPGSDYSLFKKGIMPMWEDEHNKKGGRWLFTLEGRRRADVDDCWLDVVLTLIGETLDRSEQICGAAVNIKHKFDKIAVWTADASDSASVLEIGRQLKETLPLPPDTMLDYEVHIQKQGRGRAPNKYLFTI